MAIRKSCNEKMTVDQEHASEKKILNFYFNFVVLPHCILFNTMS